MNKNRLPILEWSIPLTYILAQYYFPGTTLPFGMVITFVILLLYFLMHTQNRFYLNKSFAFLFCFMVVHDCLRVIYSPLAIGQMIVYSLITILIFMSTGNIDEDKLYRAWSVLGGFAIFGIAYQALQVYIFRSPVSMINLFPFLGTATEKATALSFRPCSFFLEPASYCSWITPLLYMALKRKSTVFAIIVSVSLLLSTSAIGMLMLFVCWGYTLVFQSGGMNKGIKVIGGAFIIITFIYAILNLGVFSSSLGRLYQLQEELMYGGGSSYRRLIAGYKIYGELPILSKLFGIPYQTIQQLLLSGTIDYRQYYISTTSMDFGYVNTISRCLIMYGAFGFMIFAYFILMLWKDANRENRELLILLIISMFTQSTYFNSIFLLQFSFYLGIMNVKSCVPISVKTKTSYIV